MRDRVWYGQVANGVSGTPCFGAAHLAHKI